MPALIRKVKWKSMDDVYSIFCSHAKFTEKRHLQLHYLPMYLLILEPLDQSNAIISQQC